MRSSDFEFDLPGDLIAQVPEKERDLSRLLVLDRRTGAVEHRSFRDLGNFLTAGDVLVMNDSRVIPARLRGANAKSVGAFEMLLLEEVAANDWWVMLRPGRRARVHTQINLRDSRGGPAAIKATVMETNDEGHRRVRFEGTENILEALDELGEVPLPPYIERSDTSRRELDRKRYQTVYSRTNGSVAAPTAGLHFTERLLDEIR